jgi:hypothetical protein
MMLECENEKKIILKRMLLLYRDVFCFHVLVFIVYLNNVLVLLVGAYFYHLVRFKMDLFYSFTFVFISIAYRFSLVDRDGDSFPCRPHDDGRPPPGRPLHRPPSARA